MTWQRSLCVLIGGAIGAWLRYALTVWTQERFSLGFPYGTLFVNWSGAFLIGLLMTAMRDHFQSAPEWRFLLITGVLGGYTTFSAFTWETFELAAGGFYAKTAGYLGGTLVGGFAALAGGICLGRLL